MEEQFQIRDEDSEKKNVCTNSLISESFVEYIVGCV